MITNHSSRRGPSTGRIAGRLSESRQSSRSTRSANRSGTQKLRQPKRREHGKRSCPTRAVASPTSMMLSIQRMCPSPLVREVVLI